MNHKIARNSIAVITWEDPSMAEGLDLPTRVGLQFLVNLGHPEAREMISLEHEIVTFRLRDEDDEVHYKGLVRNDPYGENQSFLSDWGAADTGGFLIEVYLDGKWEMEVG
jgi:hypothetical protein